MINTDIKSNAFETSKITRNFCMLLCDYSVFSTEILKIFLIMRNIFEMKLLDSLL